MTATPTADIDTPRAPKVAAPHPPGSWFSPERQAVVAAAEILDRAAAARTVLLGETHDRPEVHRWQLHVAAALHARGRKIAIGYEMFPRRLQPVLDRWTAGEIDTENFLRESEWFDVWGFDPELYLPLFHFCRQNRIPMLALNCYRALVTRVRLEGWDAIPEPERDGLTPSAPPTADYRDYLRSLMGGMAGRGAPPASEAVSDGFIAAQQTWDRAFAVNIARALDAADPPLVIGIIGRGHLEYGHGTPYQLRDLGIADTCVLLTATAEDSPERALAPGIADAVFALDRPDPAPPRPSRLGLRFTGAAGLTIESLDGDGPGAGAGLAAGDRIVAIAGAAAAARRDLSAVLRRVLPGTLLPIEVERAGGRLTIIVALPPTPPQRSQRPGERPPWPG